MLAIVMGGQHRPLLKANLPAGLGCLRGSCPIKFVAKQK
jgi:hypothetical protein